MILEQNLEAAKVVKKTQKNICDVITQQFRFKKNILIFNDL
jgi:hypothetical protein